MGKLNKNELSDISTDVRQAYRLLYSYQQRILDVVKYISNKLDIELIGGHPIFSNSNINGKINLDQWSWDWLPMQTYEFDFSTDKYSLSIYNVSDSGYFEVKDIEPTEVDKFASVTKSTSKLIFVIGKKDIWAWDEIEESPLIKTNGDSDWIEPESKFVAKAYDISEFVNGETTDQVLKDFLDTCKKNKVTYLKDREI